MPFYDTRDLGPLPVDLINAILGTDLEPGNTRLSARAHEHIAADHPADYAICLDALADAIAAPSFIGQDPKQRENFYLVKRIGLEDGRAVLVAISLEIDRHGFYGVRSSYLIPQRTIDARRQARRLFIVPPR